MKTILSSILTIMFAWSLTAQSSDYLKVDVTKLNADQLTIYKQLKTMESQNREPSELTIEKIDKYAQIGKAFGTAFKECWTAVSSDAERFANSSAGKWAMVMVTWKIMGNDTLGLFKQIIRYAFGGFLLCIGIPVFIYILKKNCVQSQSLKSRTKIGPFTYKSEYNEEIETPIHADCIIAYGVFFVIFVVMVNLIMFV